MIGISKKYLERHAVGMGRPIGIHLGYFYDTFKVTFWINSVHLAQPIKLFYKTKVIYLLIFKNLYYNKKFKGKI
jgi:hypothetical protein